MLWFAVGLGQDNPDTTCLPRLTVVDLLNDLAKCDTANVILGERVSTLEVIRGDLLMQNDSYRRMNGVVNEENQELKNQITAANKEVVKSKLINRVIIATSVIAEIVTIYLFIR